MAVYRAALNLSGTNNANDHALSAQVFFDTQRFPQAIVMTIARLRYLARMLTHAPPLIRVLVDITWDDPRGWAHQLQADYDWLLFHTDPARRPTDATSIGLIRFVLANPRAYRPLISSAICHAKPH
eukprot:602523-Pyramimonas_sp.AAC.1